MIKSLVMIFLIFQTLGICQEDTTQVEKSPKKAIRYSLFPGGGQVYNGKYLKAILILSAETWTIIKFIQNQNLYLDTDPNSQPKIRERYRERRNKFAWWSGFVYIYNLVDALVDSHLANFNERNLNDLPEETGEENSREKEKGS